jgi:hypothetical protein
MIILFVILKWVAIVIFSSIMLLAFCLPTHLGRWWLSGYLLEWKTILKCRRSQRKYQKDCIKKLRLKKTDYEKEIVAFSKSWRA